MMKLSGYVMVGAFCALCAIGCKKKAAGTPAAGSGSGSAMAAGSGSGSGSAMAAGSGSGSAEAGSGSAMAAGSGSAADTGSGSGSAMAGSGSGSAAAGSGSAADTGAAADPEGSRHWNCKKDCKLALKCKSAADFHDLKECEQDCTNLAKDKDGRYERGAAESAAYYTCIDKVSDCAGVKKCDHPK